MLVDAETTGRILFVIQKLMNVNSGMNDIIVHDIGIARKNIKVCSMRECSTTWEISIRKLNNKFNVWCRKTSMRIGTEGLPLATI
jgi:hypothetical protein